MKTKILITGINGFIGKNLVSFFLGLKKEIKLYGLDIRKPVRLDKRITFFKCDILKIKNLYQVFKKIKPDIIFHLAAQSSVPESFKNPKRTFKINIDGTLNILEAVRKFCPKAIILIPGSSEEYDGPKSKSLTVRQTGKIKENQLLRPLSPYAISKACQEFLGYQYFSTFNLKIILVRVFNVTGPNQGSKAICGRFAEKIAEIEIGKAKPVMKVGNLNIVRDFLDVRDLARAYWLAVKKCKPGEAYNIASGKGYEIEKVLKKLLSFSKKEIKIKKDTRLFRKKESLVLIGNVTKFKKITGWKPKIDFLNQTLPELLNYWRKRV